jgi:hypothetical protein
MTQPDAQPGVIEWFLSPDGQAALAGALGGLVRWITLRERWTDGVAALIVGAICAMYLGPLIEPILTPTIGRIAPRQDATGFSAFVVGLGGISLSGLLIDLIRARRAQTKRGRNGSDNKE